MTKKNKHKIRREVTANSKQINTLLYTHKPNDMLKVNKLIKKNQELLSLLKPPEKTNRTHFEPIIKSPLEEIEKQYFKKIGTIETKVYCRNCGAPNGYNRMNGKPWCFKCNRPLTVTYKKPEKKANPKLKGVTVEEQEAFFLKQNSFMSS